MKEFIVSAFYTKDTPYKDILYSQLIPSLDKLNIKYNVEEVENKGSWLKNVAMKPLVILNALEKYPSKNIVCLDADCQVLEYPSLFNNIPEEFDIALHILDWDTWYKNNSHVKEVLSGTIWLRNNEKMRNIVKLWYEKAIQYNSWEQKVLAEVLEQQKIKIFELPIEYCFLNTLPDGSSPKVQCDKIVIKHFQASRKYKRLIK